MKSICLAITVIITGLTMNATYGAVMSYWKFNDAPEVWKDYSDDWGAGVGMYVINEQDDSANSHLLEEAAHPTWYNTNGEQFAYSAGGYSGTTGALSRLPSNYGNGKALISSSTDYTSLNSGYTFDFYYKTPTNSWESSPQSRKFRLFSINLPTSPYYCAKAYFYKHSTINTVSNYYYMEWVNINTNGTDVYWSKDNVYIPDDTWQHYRFVWDKIHTSLYINDTLIRQQDFNGALNNSENIDGVEFSAYGTWDEIKVFDSEPEPPAGTVITIH